MSAGSYIGRSPQYGFFEKQLITTANGVLVTFALNFTTADSAQLLVSVGGVIQQTGAAYTVDGSTPQNIVFTEAPSTGIEIFIIWLGKQTTGPTFSSGMLTDKTSLGAQPASADTFLLYDDDASLLKKVTYSNLIPIFTLILSAIILGEVLDFWQWVSIFVVFAGVMISQRHQELVVDIPLNDAGDDPINSADTSHLKSVPDASESKG